MRTLVAAVSFAATLAVISFENLAVAENLVLNGGFEEEWVPESGPPHWLTNAIQTNLSHSGAFAAAFVDSQFTDSLAQDVPTTPGSFYLLTFWLANPSFGTTEPPNNNLSFGFGTAGMSWVNAPYFEYTEFSFTAQALETHTTLQFIGRNQPTAWQFDDVSVTLIPEPSTFSLVALGMLALAGFARRRPHSPRGS